MSQVRVADSGHGNAATVTWSHYHWDHVGDMTQFPPSTSVTVGRGFKADPNLLPGYPINLKSPVLASDFANRELCEISFEGALRIGGLPAHDYFGDGSFYLLDTPGHCVGHMCGLARTTPSHSSHAGDGSTFIFMGGDICHFAGVFRPSPSVPLTASCCPAEFHERYHRLWSDAKKNDEPHGDPATTPLYSVSTHKRSAYVEPHTAAQSVLAMKDHFDAASNVLVLIAHDPAVLGARVLPTLNERPSEDLTDWFAKGWKGQTHWCWLTELPRAQDAGRPGPGVEPGRPPIVEGWWRDGKRWDRDKRQEVERAVHVAATREGRREFGAAAGRDAVKL